LLQNAASHQEGLIMLYQLYETQRAMLSPFSEFASASSKLYSHPLSPFAHTPMAAARVGRPRPDAPSGQGVREAAVRYHTANVGGVDVAVQEQVAMEQAVLSAAALQALHRQPAGAVGR
jgi:poly(3-hydroxybutyrate) depolymerase